MRTIKSRSRTKDNTNELSPSLPPVLTPTSLSLKEVKARTGFVDASCLIGFAVIVCDGDLLLLSKKISYLSWYEEWFIYFEYLYGRTVTSIYTTAILYNSNRKTIAKIISSKMALTIHCRNKWPTYATMKEDLCLRNDKWQNRYVGRRVVFHDNT